MSAGGECKGDLASESKYADGGVDRDAKVSQPGPRWRSIELVLRVSHFFFRLEFLGWGL